MGWNATEICSGLLWRFDFGIKSLISDVLVVCHLLDNLQIVKLKTSQLVAGQLAELWQHIRSLKCYHYHQTHAHKLHKIYIKTTRNLGQFPM